MRYAAWQKKPLRLQLPPRYTRLEASTWSAHHCHTLPCMSHNPSLFGGYAPTLVGRSRSFPFGAFPEGSYR
jgi:hypothetical protein